MSKEEYINLLAKLNQGCCVIFVAIGVSLVLLAIKWMFFV